MSIESVAQVETDLGLTARDTEVLRGVKLVWQRLQRLRGQALKDDKFTGQYRDLLEKGIAQARSQQFPDDPDEIAAKARAFWLWYNAQCQELNIVQREKDRGMPHAAWCEKWLTPQYRAFEEAITRTVDEPSTQRFEEAKARAIAMLRAYLGAI